MAWSIFPSAAEVCALGFDLWNCGALVFLVLLVSGGILADLERARRERFFSFVFWPAILAWHWGAKWSWTGICSLGWLGMVTLSEYGVGIFFLTLATFGAISKVCHEGSKTHKILKVFMILTAFILAVVMTATNKADKPWSPTFNLVDSRLAERRPWPIPWSPTPKWTIPAAAPIATTPAGAWKALQEQLAEEKHPRIAAPPAPVIQVVQPEKAHVEFTFTPVRTWDFPIREKYLPMVGGAVEVTLSFMVKDHMAKGLPVWLRLCQGCSYGREPNDFEKLPGVSEPTERVMSVGNLLPGAIFAPSTTFSVIPPPSKRGFTISLTYGCENCDVLDPDKSEVLTVRYPN
jgi:hypothetical protein